MTPTARTLELLRELGYTAQVVEQWVPQSRTRRDLYGCIDVLACHAEHGILGIQATTGGNFSARMKKAKAEPRLQVWLAAGGKFAVWGWSKQGARGKRKLWKVRREGISL